MNGRDRLTWVETTLKVAKLIAESRSEDPYVQVGACGIKHDNTLVVGYNGAVPGIEIDWSNRDKRRPYVLHAESNLLDLCRPGELKFISSTHIPCPECLKRIAKYRVNTVYYISEDYNVNVDSILEMAKFLNVKLIKI